MTDRNKHLSAAPAPEGGAVKKACVDFQEAIDDFEAEVADVMAEGSERADLWDREIMVNIDALKTVMSAAIATREEAPAEAGERECGWCDGRKTKQTPSTDFTIPCPYCKGTGKEALRAQPPSREEAPAEAGELVWFDVRDVPQDGTSILLNHRTHGIIQGWFSKGEWSDDTPISPREYSGDMWILGDDLYQDEVEFGEGGVVLPSGVLGWLPLSALRAQPPARSLVGAEDARWLLENYGPTSPRIERIANALLAQPAREDAQRVAVEALEAINHIRSEMVGVPVDSEAANAWAMALDAAADHARQALAALQAEQKGGA